MWLRLARFFWCRSPSARRGLRSWMIRDRLDLRLIHYRFSTLVGSTGRDNPELGDLAASSARAGFDTAWIDALIVREIELRIHGTFCREVRTFLTWIGRPNDHQSRIGLTLQTQSHVVEYGFRRIVDAPRLLQVREFDLVDLAGLRRRWWRRRRSLNRHSRLAIAAKVAIIGRCAGYGNRPWLGTLRAQRCRCSVGRYRASGRVEFIGQRTIIFALAIRRDGCTVALADSSWICRAGNRGRALLLHVESRRAGSSTLLSIGDIGGDGVRAGSQASRVDVHRLSGPVHLAASRGVRIS